MKLHRYARYPGFPAVLTMHTAVASGRWCGGQWPQCGLSGHHESAH